MERAEWLRQVREQAEALYDRVSPQYWVTFGLTEDGTHRKYLRMFVERVAPGGAVLSAACGAGRYDGILLAAGYRVVGIDQSAGMLARARERFPQARYQKIALQEMDFHEAFDGVICMDAMEHICPEDYPSILQKFHEALKPGRVLYFTADTLDLAQAGKVQAAYERARERGLPVVLGEVVDELEAAYRQVQDMEEQVVPGALAGIAVYHYLPPLAQVRVWIEQAGLAIEQQGPGSGWYHFIARKR